jgi:hypothetical protein
VPDWCHAAPTKVHPRVAAIGPAQVRKRLRERGEGGFAKGIVFIAPLRTPMRRTP